MILSDHCQSHLSCTPHKNGVGKWFPQVSLKFEYTLGKASLFLSLPERKISRKNYQSEGRAYLLSEYQDLEGLEADSEVPSKDQLSQVFSPF